MSPQAREGPKARSTLKPHSLPIQLPRSWPHNHEREDVQGPPSPPDACEDTGPVKTSGDLGHHFCLESAFGRWPAGPWQPLTSQGNLAGLGGDECILWHLKQV